jgi:glutamate racemase
LTKLPAQHSILVLDSGVGGLSVCQSILENQPDLQIIYFADDAYFPYGLLDEQILRERLHEIVCRMLQLHQPDLVVLACNTVSTLVLPELRANFDIPFVGVVPAIKPAAAISKTGQIGLLATPATVRRPYTDQLIQDYASDCDVQRVGSNGLVEQAEVYLSGQVVDERILREALLPFERASDETKVDTIVLGCTHFPLLKAALSKIMTHVTWVDSGAAIAKRVTSLLGDENGVAQSVSDDFESPCHQIYFSKMTPNEEVFSHALLGLGFKQYQLHCFSAKMD